MASGRLRSAFCASLVALGTCVVVGWLFEIELLKSVVPGLSTMKFNTAVGFLLAGFGIGLADAAGRQARLAAAGIGSLLILLGAATLAQYATGLGFGIDELVVRDLGVLTGSGVPGRMSPLTAMAWLAVGAAIILLALGKSRQAVTAGHIISLGAGFVAFLAAAGYAFGAEAFWGIGFYTAMAIHTAIGLLVAVAAALMTRKDEGWLSSIGDAPIARGLFLQFLPVALLLPLLLGFLILLGSGIGAYNAAFGFALFVPATTIALTVITLLLAKQARDSELAAQQSSAALRATEERYRRFFEQTSDLILTAGLDQVINDCNPAAAAAVGLRREEAIGRKISEFVSEEDFAQTTSMLRRKLERGGTTRYDVRVRSSTGEWLFWEINSGLTYADDGSPVGLHVVGRDVTERKRAEQHQHLLINELNHRVKNTLAVVQGIAHQTLRNSDAPASSVREALEGRLAALSAAHDVLTRESWTSASMREIVADALAPFCRDNRCSILGPDLRLKPKTAVSLALAVHELATNASKYGALLNDEGRIIVEWSTDSGRLKFVWREEGGPEVSPPMGRGFGSRMIERGFAAELGGSATLSFEPNGVLCSVDAPIPEAD